MTARVTKDDYGTLIRPFARRRSSLQVYRTFLGEFQEANGSQLVILLGFLTALGTGSLVGVVPQVISQRFAEVFHGLEDGQYCHQLTASDIPEHLACRLGADHAQSAASYCVLVRNLMALFVNSFAGSYSDSHGRKGVQILALLLMIGAPVSFLAIQLCPWLHPILYYVMDAFNGVLNPFSIAFMQLSDVLPPRHRAPAFGLYFGAFMGGIAIAPFLATLLPPTGVAIFASTARLAALAISIFVLPETLSMERQREAAARAKSQESPDSRSGFVGCTLLPVLQPFGNLKILQRSTSLVLVAFAAFVSKLVMSATMTLFFYYIENNLGATQGDVAGMMFVVGVLGVLVQAGFLKYLISLLGERRLVVVSFGAGVVHNLVYGLAATKAVVFVGLCISPLTNTNHTLVSSLASRMVTSTEQGQIQGALFGLTSLAEAIGPVLFNFAYQNWHAFGPGTMFVVGAMLMAVGMVAISLVPPIPATNGEDSDDTGEEDSLIAGGKEEQQALVA